MKWNWLYVPLSLLPLLSVLLLLLLLACSPVRVRNAWVENHHPSVPQPTWNLLDQKALDYSQSHWNAYTHIQTYVQTHTCKWNIAQVNLGGSAARMLSFALLCFALGSGLETHVATDVCAYIPMYIFGYVYDCSSVRRLASWLFESRCRHKNAKWDRKKNIETQEQFSFRWSTNLTALFCVIPFCTGTFLLYALCILLVPSQSLSMYVCTYVNT